MNDELEALTGEAAAVDLVNAPAPVPGAEDQSTPVTVTGNEAAEIAGLLTIVTGLFSPVFPSLAEIYTKETIQSIADAAVPVMAKRGWTTGALLGRYAEEITLCAVAFPVAFATYQGISADVAKAKKASAENPAIAEPVTVERRPDDAPLVAERG